MILSKTRSDRRDRRLCRFGVMLVICSLLVNMVAVPKAKAVVIDATAAFGAAAATAAINGTTATTLFTGMSTSAATTAMTTLMGEYATATGAAASGTALAGMIGAGTIVTAAGALVLTAAAGYAVYKFIEWLREDKGLEAGGESVVVFSDNMFLLQDGTLAFVYSNESSAVSGFKYSVDSDDIIFSSGAKWTFSVSNPGYFYAYGPSGGVSQGFYVASWIDSGASYFNAYFAHTDGISNPSNYSLTFLFYDDQNSIIGRSSANQYLSYWSETYRYSQSEISLQPNSELQTIPQEIPDGQAMVISGIENLPQADPQAAADAIMQSAIDGALDPVVTVEADPTVTPDPDPDPDGSTEVEPDPDGPELPSNLGDLGAALTTRFPFSIPWDIARAIKLIAAPAKAPYWEVDFLAPIAYRLPEGWKGSTKIVLDFGQPEYEIIGIASRWTSTIGFCLALAAATKRFIWTA